MPDSKKWFAVYTKPRWEKKVNNLFIIRGFESYCPLNKVRRQWSDRIKLVDEPLFKGYVFVHIYPEDQTKIRMVSGVLNFVYWLGRPAIIKESEIKSIKRFLEEHEYIEVEKIEFEATQRVEVTSGVLMNSTGKVLKVTKKKVQVVLDSIGLRLVTYIDKQKLRAIKKS